MRTTLAIDDDVLAAARHLAQQHGKSVGETISSLARQALQGDRPHRQPHTRNGVLLLPSRSSSTPVTLELVNQLRDEAP